MNNWLLSLVGIAFLGVFIDILSPKGSMEPFIKFVYSLIVIYIIISPIISWVSGVDLLGLENYVKSTFLFIQN